MMISWDDLAQKRSTATASSTGLPIEEPTSREFVQDDHLPKVKLQRGMYVRLRVGPHTGLYGWVMRQMFDEGVWYVAVAARCDLVGLYQWYRAEDVRPAEMEDEGEETSWRDLPRLRK